VSKLHTVASDEFVNWSGGLRFAPQDEDALRACIVAARRQGDVVRAMGSGHSSSPLVRTPGVLISLDHFAD
jgi:hypothetical protein